MTDTDSLMHAIKTEYFYRDIKTIFQKNLILQTFRKTNALGYTD